MKLSLELSLHPDDLGTSARYLQEFQTALQNLATPGVITDYPAPPVPVPVDQVLPTEWPTEWPTTAPQVAAVQDGPEIDLLAPGLAVGAEVVTLDEPATGVDLDKAGLPWDSRIHSDAQEKKSKEGYWKRRRNVSDETVATVEAELRALMAIPVGGIPTPPPVDIPTPPPVDIPTPPPVDIPTPPPVDIPTPPPVDIPTPPPVEAIAGGPSTLADFMKLVTPKTQNGELTMARINKAVRAVGLTAVPQLNQRPDLIPVVARDLGLV